MTDIKLNPGFKPGNDEWLKGVEIRRLPKIADLRELARNMTPKAMKRVYDALDDDDNRIRLQAANIILDRAWGKASPADPELQESLQVAHLEALRAITAGANADVVTPEKQADLRKQLESLPKVEVTDVEDLNDINDLADSEVNDVLNTGPEQDDVTEE